MRDSDMSDHSATAGLDEFLSRVFSFTDADAALRYGLSRVTQTLDAAAVAVGFARGVPTRELRGEVGDAGKSTELPGIGLCRIVTAPLDEDGSGHVALVLRGKTELRPQDLEQLQSMTRVLGVASRSLRSLAAEQALRVHSEQQ